MASIIIQSAANVFTPSGVRWKSLASVNDAFHSSRLPIDSIICMRVSSTILSCCKDINSILFNLLSKERANIRVVLNKINMAAKHLFKIFCSTDIIVILGRHHDKEINIAALMMITTGNGAKKAHRCDAKTLLQFRQVTSDNVNILLR